MKVKSSEIKELIAYEMGKELIQDGFVFKKSNNWFISSDATNDYILYILLHPRLDHCSVEVSLFIRQKQVEKIYKKILGETTGITIGNSIGLIYNSPDGRKIVRNLMEIIIFEHSDILAAVETIKGFYLNIAKPYFSRYNDLDALDDIINNPPFEYSPAHVGGMFGDRFMRGLIISKILKKTSFHKLCLDYEEFINSTLNQKTIEEFIKVKEYLSTHNPT